MEKEIEISIKLLNGDIFDIKICQSELVLNLMWKIESQLHVIPSQQRLIFKGKNLESHKSLDQYDVVDDSTVHCVEMMNSETNTKIVTFIIPYNKTTFHLIVDSDFKHTL